MNPEITTTQLHSELMDSVKTKGAIVDDVSGFVTDFLQRVGGGMAPENVLLIAEINQTRLDIAKLQEKVAQDVYKWVDTRAQGDLFVDQPFRCPKIIKVGDESVSCYAATMTQIHEYLGYIAQLRGKAAKAARDVAELKEQWHELAAMEHARCGAVIDRAKQNGIDPNTLRIARDAS